MIDAAAPRARRLTAVPMLVILATGSCAN